MIDLHKSKLILNVSPYMYKAVRRAAYIRGCTNAEIVRTALFEHLRKYVLDERRKEVTRKYEKSQDPR